MKSVNVLDIIRKVLSVLTVLFLFLPWIVVNGSVSAVGVSSSASESEIGIKTIIALLIPIVLVVTIFLGSKNEKWNVLFLYAPIAGVIITVLIGIFYRPSGFKMSSSAGVSASASFSWGIGLWLTLIVYIAIFVITLIIRLNISKESLKKDGIKGIASKSVNELKNSAFEIRDGAGDKGDSDKNTQGTTVQSDNFTKTSIMDKVPISGISESMDKSILREKKVSNNTGNSSGARRDYLDMKAKLDDALRSDIITDDEYKKKLQHAKIKYVKDDTIERIETQFELDIITAEERDAKLEKLNK